MVLKQKMKQILSIVIPLICAINVFGQDWDKRHKFAKAYFGVSTHTVLGMRNGSFLNSSGAIQSFERSGFLSPAINVGSTHFWGYADFFVSFNTRNIKFEEDELENDLGMSIFTGLKVYPFPLTENTIRPYLGYKFSPFSYEQKNIVGQGYKFTQVKSVFDIGVAIQLPRFYLSLEYSRIANPAFDTYISRTIKSGDKFPSQVLQLGVNYSIEMTKKISTQKNKDATDFFSASNNYGLFLAVGPSSAFPIVSSDYITDLYPFLNDKEFPSIFLDYGLGYHFTKLDFITALSFRQMNQTRAAYDFELRINRKSLLLETYKFIGDYHGFVPYLGAGISYENLQLSEYDEGGETAQLIKNKLSPSIVFGWDIRPSVQGDWWLLRTNLRYSPFLDLENQGKSLSLQHLEFNFIQFVIYPQKLFKISKQY